MKGKSYYMVNGITLYRLIAAPALLVLIFTGHRDIFGWLLAFSFLTDAIDGYLARRYGVVSVMGAKLDSIADDLTVLVAIIGLFVWHWPFIIEEYIWVLLLLVLYLLQLAFALFRYGKATSFHTYLAKVAAVFQGIFLVVTFFQSSPPQLLFLAAVVLTALDLIEETIMVAMLPKWQADVKGIFQAMRHKSD
ncbi:CDP-alcohol phosphatidyltransferase family protein [Olivibacter sitiensis]|uniref:CDP-alcohol phosphatidyltransferase family protein n=1 Tax=Olivibacter sitiensis TaxID=376470 RepID=UPI00040F8849|nr:CDP-alcohol phosphatidyltransferase family protein [Olivibacter sitiensis]